MSDSDKLDFLPGEGLNITRHSCYTIYELTPAPWGDDYRVVKVFDRVEDAEAVLEALEKVNIDFSYYKIIRREF